MVGSSSWVQVSSRPTVLSLTPGITFPTDSLSSVSSSSRSFLPHLPNRSLKKLARVQASSANTGQDSRPSSSEKKNPLAVVLGIPGTIWKQTLRPLSDFGFGKKSVWEGGVGLFVVSGAVLLALSLAWLRGFQMRSRFRKYQAVLQFTEACGISTGTAVRIRGVTVGSVIRLNPSLKSIDAVIEETIKGSKGVSLDELVGIFTRLGRDMEVIGVHKTFDLAERVASVIEEAKPLLAKIEAMAEDLEPLLSEVRDSGLLKEVEGLTKNLSAATEDMRKMHSSIMTPENTERIRKSIYSFLFTLKNIENISSDISGFTGDEPTRRNLKLLIKSLSRLL
ncbi:protein TRIGALACTOSYLDIACYLGLYCEROL 2, chloroplastic-like isoform X2 [Papaver somniferum]|uniref:protein TRIGALACTOSYLDIACYLGLYCEROL 2, chloroplastic-like isoform X2 n=1 Tax=Papaver somniferum TaxID=3469 RepID=UPI000E6F7B68|nr:protein TRIGALACTOSYLDIACYLGLYCEROL 2, chloroplastic-like isoform X2 [Papaver somniferum]